MNQLAIKELDRPLVSAAEAKNMWQEYVELEEAILTDDDYMWFCEFQEVSQGRPRMKKYTYGTRALAEDAVAHRPGSILKKRKVKSATRKMGKFFALEMPVEEEIGTGEVEIRREGDFVIQIERSKFYTITVWMNAELETIKASCTVVVRSPSGRTWIGHGGSHRKEGREDFTISETAFTRAVNRAILDFVGFGEESAEDTATTEPLPGEAGPPAAPAAPAPAKSNGRATPQTPAPTQAIQDKRKTIVETANSRGLSQEFMRGVLGNRFKKERLADLTAPELDQMLKVVQDAKLIGSAEEAPPEGPESPTEPPVHDATQSAAPSDTVPEQPPADQDSANP